MNDSLDQLVNQVVALLKADSTNKEHFFSKEENPQWIKYLEPHGYFKPDTIKPKNQDGSSIYYPVWPQGIYLEKVGQQIGNSLISDPEVIDCYLKIIRELLTVRENVWAIRAIFRSLFSLSIKHLTKLDIKNAFDMIEVFVDSNSFIEFDIHECYFKLLNNVNNTSHDRSIFKEYLQQLLKSHDEDGIGFRERKLLFFHEHRFKEFEKKYLKFETYYPNKVFLMEDAINIIFSHLLKLLEKDDVDKSSRAWRPAIEDHYQNQYHNSAPSILTSLLFKICNFLIKKEIQPKILDDIKESKKITLTRLYIALVTENPTFLDINNCAKRILKIGLRSSYRHEVFHFLNKHFDNLPSSSQESILNNIDSLYDKYSDENDERRPLLTAWTKLRWLQSIKNSKNQNAIKLYEENLSITGSESDHPDFDSFIGRTFVGPTSPWSIEDFKNASADQIFEKLKNYTDTDRAFGEPSVEGMARVFEEYVHQAPQKCSFLLNQMLDLPHIYLSSLYDGYTKAWTDGGFVPVSQLLNLANHAISNINFKKSLTEDNSKSRWAMTSIFRFISAGVRDDERAFDQKFNKNCHDFLKLSLTLIKPSDSYKSSSDAQTRAINEPRGVLFQASILLALREARLVFNQNDKSSKETPSFKRAWSNLYEIIKEPLHSSSKDEVSLHAHLGSMYRQILFLNRDWLYDNLDLVCPPNEIELRSAFIQGFCYVDAYVKDMYFWLYNKGYLLEFLRETTEAENQGSRVNTLQDRIISLGLISFLLEHEDLEQGLIKDILECEDGDEWREIVNSLPRVIGDEAEQKIKDNASIIINFMIDKFESVKNKKDFKKHFSGFGWLLKIFDNPSLPIIEKIMLIGSYYSEHWDHFETVDFLDRFKDSHTRDIGRMFLSLTKNSKTLLTYPDERIKRICIALKNNGETETLTSIKREYSDKLPSSPLTHEICNI